MEALLSSWSYSDDHEPISELEEDQVSSQLFLASNHQKNPLVIPKKQNPVL